MEQLYNFNVLYFTYIKMIMKITKKSINNLERKTA